MSDQLNVPPEKGVVVTPEGDGLSNLLGALPDSVALRVATIAARYGIDPRSDPVYALVEAVKLGADCAQAAAAGAAAAGSAARAVQAGVSAIPDQICQGAARARAEVEQGLKGGAETVARTLAREAFDGQRKLVAEASAQQEVLLAAAVLKAKAVIAEASARQSASLAEAALNVEKIKTAATMLLSSLDAALQDKMKNGVRDFSEAATRAGERAARSASAWRYAWSLWGIFSVLVLCVTVGSVGTLGWLDAKNRITPGPILNIGGRVCGMATIVGVGRRDVCILQPHGTPAHSLSAPSKSAALSR